MHVGQLTAELFHHFHQIQSILFIQFHQYIDPLQSKLLERAHAAILSSYRTIFVYICMRGRENRYNTLHNSTDRAGPCGVIGVIGLAQGARFSDASIGW